MMSYLKRITFEIKQFEKGGEDEQDCYSPHCQLSLPNPEDPKKVHVELKVVNQKSLYANGKVKFELDFSESTRYPYQAPKVTCLTPIYHLNIHGSYTCLRILSEWTNKDSIAAIVRDVRVILDSPNEDAAWDPAMLTEYKTKRADYNKKAQASVPR